MTGAELEAVGRALPLLPLSPSEATGAMAAYRELCRAILTPDDMQRIGEREFVKRSGFQKLAAAYGVSTEIVALDVDRDDDDQPIRARAVVRATHPNGRHAEGDGACARTEKGRRGSDKMEHDLRGTATTRATNRAISNLCAFGAVSAEEADADAGASTGLAGTPPAWGMHVDGDELADAAHTMVAVVAALGIPDGDRAAAVKALGAAIRGECDGGIPRCVVRVIEHLRDFTAPPDADTVSDPPSGDAPGTDGATLAPTASQPTTA